MLEVDIIFILIQFLVVVCRHHRKRLFILIIKSIETRQNVNEREKELEMPIISDVIRHPFCVLLLKEHFHYFILKI